MPTNRLNINPIPKPIAVPASAPGECEDGIWEVAIIVETKIRRAKPIPRKDGIKRIIPIILTISLKRGILVDDMERVVLHALQSNIKFSISVIFVFEAIRV